MKFTVSKPDLVAAVSHVGRATGTTMPVHQAILCSVADGVMHLAATNGERSISDSVAIDGEGTAAKLIPARLFGDIVRSLPGETVTLDFGNAEDVLVTGGSASFNVRTLATGDFPQMSGPVGEGHKLKASELIAGFRQVVPAASADTARPILTAVSFSSKAAGLELAATDSYRLAIRTLGITAGVTDGNQVLVPASALAEAVRLFAQSDEITIWFGARDMTIESGSLRLTSRLVEGEYPKYSQVTPQTTPHSATVVRTELVDAVKRAQIITGNLPIRLTFNKDVCKVGGLAADIGTAADDVACEFDGDDELSISFNPAYFGVALAAFDGETIKIGLTDALKPALLEADTEPGLRYIMMPVRN